MDVFPNFKEGEGVDTFSKPYTYFLFQRKTKQTPGLYSSWTLSCFCS